MLCQMMKARVGFLFVSDDERRDKVQSECCDEGQCE